MKKKARATMKDVAALAGVSPTAVSFVVNDTQTAQTISPETRRKIEAAIRELGYRPNPAAKLLRTNRSKVLGLITDKIATTPFAGDTIRGAQSAAWKNGYLLMLINTEGRREREREALDLLLDRQVDGVIYASMYTREVEALPESLDAVPSILVDCFSARGTFNYVIPDEHYGALTATEHLIAKGHERIAFVNGSAGFYASEERLLGYKEALERAGLEYRPDLVANGNWWPDSGYEHSLRLLQRQPAPTAIFCGNDRMALGCLQAAAKLGLEVPGDIAVVGYDGELITRRMVPPLTTVKLPHFEMGKAAVQYLVEHSSEPAKPLQRKIRGRLIERQSS